VPAYYKNTVQGFLEDNPGVINSELTSQYANDGYYQLLGTQSKSWADSVPMMKSALHDLLKENASASSWGLLLEYPLYRLRKRIDLVLVSPQMVFVVEFKVGADEAAGADIRQVEEYALDLRDFHKASHDIFICPILCCTELNKSYVLEQDIADDKTLPVTIASTENLAQAISIQHHTQNHKEIDWRQWEQSSYEPVPTIIEAATTIFAGHSIRDLSRADADNLSACSREVVRLVEDSRQNRKKRIIVVTGVPGAGKTLAGLNVVHQAKDSDGTSAKIVYLSGNTPLVLVIREALAQDEYVRSRNIGEKRTLTSIRHEIKTRIQHIIDFLKEYYRHDVKKPPFEHAIVFDEAQRAWDHKHGKDKFDRDASEPELLMEIMDRHKDWAAIVCLVGAGQEINKGEPGMRQWGEAIHKNPSWELVTPSSAINGSSDTAGTALFPDEAPYNLKVQMNDSLRLTVPIRSYRSERVSKWVDAVLENRPEDAREISRELGSYPITLVRSIEECRKILKNRTRGTRRCGLLASAGASRLVAEGLGVSLSVQDKDKIAHWYLKPHGDYRSSNSLEVTANEYTSQGLELDHTGICWGGDFVRDTDSNDWSYRRLHRTTWQNVRNADLQRYILNKYRVFLTRAREGMVLFVPYGDKGDSTRVPGTYQAVVEYLIECGIESV